MSKLKVLQEKKQCNRSKFFYAARRVSLPKSISNDAVGFVPAVIVESTESGVKAFKVEAKDSRFSQIGKTSLVTAKK